MRAPCLRVDGVSKSFPARRLSVLEDVSFEVHSGEFLAILGPSGCGKTTLLRMIAGLDLPTTGEISLNDIPVLSAGRELGMVFQSYTSFPWLTVRQNVEFALHPLRLKPRQRTRIAQFYVDLVALTAFENYFPKQLSGGMRQRVAIARALAAQPTVLLFDEPFGALDAQTRSQLQEDLQRQLLEAEEGTAIFVTHDVEEALFLADRIIVLSARPGRIVSEMQITDAGVDVGGETRTIPGARFRHRSLKTEPQFLLLRRELEDHLRQSQAFAAGDAK